MDETVARELQALIGHLRAAVVTAADVDAGRMPAPPVPSAGDFMRAMTWARAAGAVRALENVGLLSADEREAWEAEARAVVPNPFAGG